MKIWLVQSDFYSPSPFFTSIILYLYYFVSLIITVIGKDLFAQLQRTQASKFTKRNITTDVNNISQGNMS